MRKMLAAAAILAAIIAVGGWFSPQTGLKSSGGGSSGPAYGMIYGGTEGDNPLIYASSTLPFIHRVQLRYRYMPGEYALHVGQDTILLTAVSHSYGDSALSVVKEVTLYDTGLHDGDSLYVYVTIAAEDSTVLSTHEIAYGIDHDIAVLAMGNPYGGVDIFNPTGLILTDSVEVDATTFKTAMMFNNGGAWLDTCYATSGKLVQVVPTTPIFNTFSRTPLLWWPFEDYLPDNVTITDAYINLRSNATDRNLIFADGDGVSATLDTLSADIPWTEGSVGHCNASFDALQTSAQISFMSRANQTAWSPAIASRIATYWWGIRSQLCREFAAGDTTLNANEDIKIDVKDVLQYWVDFNDVRNIRQAGWLITSERAASGTNYDWAFQCGTNGTFEEYSPSLVIRYQNKKFDDYPYNGKPFVFVMTSDDGHKDTLKYQRVMDGRGKKMTMFAVRDDFGDIPYSAGYMDSADYNAFFSAGHEVGVQANDNRTMASMADSLDAYIGREFWAGILGLTGADTMALATFAYNISDQDTTTEGIALLAEYGYIGARASGNIRLSDLALGGTLPWGGPANLMYLKKWNWNELADHDDTPDSVRAKTKIQFGMSSTRGSPVYPRPIITLSHGTSTSGYSEMDTLGLGIYIDELIRRGDTDITTFGDILRLYRDAHVPDTEGGIIWRLP